MVRCLLLHDLQNDFFQNGTMNVPKPANYMDRINQLLSYSGKKNDLNVLSQDYHLPHHHSFASNNPGKKLEEKIELHSQRQVLWPDHCVQNTPGASFHPALEIQCIHFVVRKGMNPMFDSSSAFFDKSRVEKTQLHDYLQYKQVNEIVLAGLALDLGITQTALDAKELGYRVQIIEDLSPAYKIPKDKIKERLFILKTEGVILLSQKEYETNP